MRTTIATAAVMTKARLIYTMERPARHGTILQAVGRAGIQLPKRGTTQGFLTNTGDFVSRQLAYIIAEAEGQIIRNPPVSVGELFSEDIW